MRIMVKLHYVNFKTVRHNENNGKTSLYKLQDCKT